MARVEFDKALGIQALSGKFGGMIYRTLKSGKIVVCAPPSPRSSALSPGEMKHRQQFAVIAAEVARRIREGDTRSKKIIWREVKAEAERRQCGGGTEANRKHL